MPFADYKDFDDCVSKNQDKGDPEAYCAVIKRQVEGEAYRHRDFHRIYDEFINYYKDAAKGESEYYKWLQALSLDEQREYAAAAESFKWAKDMLQYLREDADNKYYKVLIGFPITSMNGNVYHERDLIAAALSLKEKSPSLNHKDEFWFSPNNPFNRWGNLYVVDAKYEDGAIEAILQVPKDAICPICNGEKMTNLIDNQHIVNVSLEGKCAIGQPGGDCKGFEFLDPPFTLLTTDVLPGIPLARIKPLESIMVEALQTSTRGKRKVKVKLTVREEDDTQKCADDEIWNPDTQQCEKKPTEQATQPEDCGEDQHWSPEQGKCVPNTEEQIAEEPSCAEGEVWDPRANKCVKAETQEGAMASFPETGSQPDDLDKARGNIGKVEPSISQGRYDALGTIAHRDPETALGTSPGTVKGHPREQATPPGVTHDPLKSDVEDRPMPTTPEVTPTSKDIKVEPTHKGVTDAGTSYAAPESPTSLPGPSDVPETPQDLAGKELGKPKEPHSTCPDGYYWDNKANRCAPNEAIAEMRKRMRSDIELVREKASHEKIVKNLIDQAVQQRILYDDIGKKYDVMKEYGSNMHHAYERATTNLLKAQHDAKVWKDERDELSGNLRDIQHSYEKLRVSTEDLRSKYHKQLSIGLELNEKLTKANEDYLEVAKENEDLKEALKRAKIMAKKTIKLKI